MIFRTAPGDAHAISWTRLPSGREVTSLPLLDRTHVTDAGDPIFARLDYRGALAWCALTGSRLATADDLEEIARVGLVLDPVTLPIAATLAAAVEHDTRTWAALHATALRPALLGKAWVHGAPLGRSWLMGWPVKELGRYSPARRGPGWIQPRPSPGSLGAHDDRHVDYSSMTYATREARPAGWIERVREEADEILDRGLAGFTRIAMPELSPHGYRCSVAELIADARALGTWHDVSSGYVPRVGDLACSRRAGGDPRTGGPGHVVRIVSVGPIHTIGGNENDMWIEAPLRIGRHDYVDVVGWIAYPPALGARCVELARAELQAGVRERPGPASHPRIQEYHAGARRGGGPRSGMPGTLDGRPVLGPRSSDEVAWCASGASWCCARALSG